MKRIIIISTSILIGISAIVFFCSGDFSKSGRGYNEYEKMLNIALKNDKELSKYLERSRITINSSEEANRNLNYFISKKKEYYEVVKKKIDTINDEELKLMLLKKINAANDNFGVEASQTTPETSQLEQLIQEQKDISLTLSILASLPIEQKSEQQLNNKLNAVKAAQDGQKSTINEGRDRLRE